MRLVLAIISFVLAAGMVGYGIAQRTFLALPPEVSVSKIVASDAPLTVIDGKSLNAFEGSQTLTIKGAGRVFAGYGRTADVKAWIGDTEYTAMSYDAAKGEFVTKLVRGTATEVPDPKGSDLWFDDFTKKHELKATINVPDDVSVIIASDGTQPAPASTKVSWPIDNSTPWAAPLIIGGAVVLLIGLALLFLATHEMRSSHGPRRKPQKMPKVPRQRSIKPSRKAISQSPRGRRRGMIAAPMILVGALALSGCSVLPGNHSTPTPTVAEAPSASHLEPPAATVHQVERIVARVSSVSRSADAALDNELIATRFDGAALELRLANYKIRSADRKTPAPAAIPAGPVKLTLPQQTAGWPRTVFAVIQNAKDAKVPPIGLFLVQQDPRSNYKVAYNITLEPSAKLPNVAPANVGASQLGADSGVLKLKPTDVALAYGEILEEDVDASAYLQFESKGDSLRIAVGRDAKKKLAQKLPSTARVAFGHSLGASEPISLAANDAGALVAVNLNETTTVRPVEAGAAVNPTGSVRALSGLAVSTKGVIATYGDQLLFYVPPAGSDKKIVLLGFTQGLVSAAEVKK
ncbi:MAG: hypothetical protein EPN91_11115 [Salinibacterium sp.]|nr:MAG: hypothetical protein EPN91_11115 [Salinibacterium sp.]